jgi:hypothetical protein
MKTALRMALLYVLASSFLCCTAPIVPVAEVSYDKRVLLIVRDERKPPPMTAWQHFCAAIAPLISPLATAAKVLFPAI